MKKQYTTQDKPKTPKVDYNTLKAPFNVQANVKVIKNGNSNTNLGN